MFSISFKVEEPRVESIMPKTKKVKRSTSAAPVVTIQETPITKKTRYDVNKSSETGNFFTNIGVFSHSSLIFFCNLIY